MLLDPVDIYCERVDVSLFSEPLNAISNLAFFIAAYAAWRLYHSRGLNDKLLLLVIGLMTLVGVGSSLFHLFANVLSQYGDVIPIVIFVLVSLYLLLRRLLAFSGITTALAFTGFVVLGWLTNFVPPALMFNGSIAYAPCLIMLFFIGTMLRLKKHPAANNVLLASLLFLISLVFRSIDMMMCDALPIGTHMLWHATNGAVLYLVARSLIISANNR